MIKNILKLIGLKKSVYPDIIIKYDNRCKIFEKWHINGKSHKEGSPAIKSWYKNGQKSYEGWYINGKLYREDGPAFIIWDENGNIEKKLWS